MTAAARLVIEEPATSRAERPAAAASLSLTQLAHQWQILKAYADEAWERLSIADEAADRMRPRHRPNDAQWDAQAQAIAASFGIPGLEEAADRVQRAANGVADLIMSIRPETVAEAALKFHILRIRYEDGRGGFDLPEKVHDFQADLDHLAGVKPSV